MFVIFLAEDHPPVAFETTTRQLIAQAMDERSQILSLLDKLRPH